MTVLLIFPSGLENFAMQTRMHIRNTAISPSHGCGRNGMLRSSCGLPRFPAILEPPRVPFDSTQRHLSMEKRSARAHASTDPVRAPAIKLESCTDETSTSGRQVCILFEVYLATIHNKNCCYVKSERDQERIGASSAIPRSTAALKIIGPSMQAVHTQLTTCCE